LNNKKKKLAIIGAGYLQLPLVKKAVELDIETYCFAIEEGAVCRKFCTKFYPISILEKEKILLLCKKINIDGILTIASDVAVPTVNFIAEEMKLNGNSIFSSLICTNKYQMKKILSECGFKVAEFHSIKSLEELQNIKTLNYPLIVKPVDRSGSLGVTKINFEEKLENAFLTAFEHSLSKEVIVEEFIQGVELSVESISMNGVHSVLALTDKVTTGEPHFVELEHHQPSKVKDKLKKEILRIIPKALSALQIKNGASHSELIITQRDEIYINEIGARMGGDFIGSHLVELSTGYDYLKGVIEVALGIYNEPIIKTRKHSGVIYACSENESFMSGINPDASYIVEYEPVSNIKKSLTKSGDRNGYFIYLSDKKIESI
jgi:biotin carboxylase